MYLNISLCSLLLFFCCLSYSVPIKSNAFTIILNTDNGTQTNRLIDNTFERSIGLCALERIKTELERLYPSITIILTSHFHHTGSNKSEKNTYNAHFANSLQVNLFISIHFYQETMVKQQVYLYRFSYNNKHTIKPSDFTFYRYDQSYFFNHASSHKAATYLKQAFDANNLFTTHSIIGCPCAPLIGVIVPAIALDIGIKNATDWCSCIEPIIHGISTLITETS